MLYLKHLACLFRSTLQKGKLTTLQVQQPWPWPERYRLKWPWACSSGPAGNMCSVKMVLLQARWSAVLPSHPLPLLFQEQWWETRWGEQDEKQGLVSYWMENCTSTLQWEMVAGPQISKSTVATAGVKQRAELLREASLQSPSIPSSISDCFKEWWGYTTV